MVVTQFCVSPVGILQRLVFAYRQLLVRTCLLHTLHQAIDQAVSTVLMVCGHLLALLSVVFVNLVTIALIRLQFHRHSVHLELIRLEGRWVALNVL